jgi:hypothetical protein
MSEINYANVLEKAAVSLDKEGRHNQADILRDVAAEFVQLRATIVQLRVALDKARGMLEEYNNWGKIGDNHSAATWLAECVWTKAVEPHERDIPDLCYADNE